MGIVKWLLREIILYAREDPAAAAARFFAECKSMRAGSVIGAWRPPPNGKLKPAKLFRCSTRSA
jgi:hypothetical protein